MAIEIWLILWVTWDGRADVLGLRSDQKCPIPLFVGYICIANMQLSIGIHSGILPPKKNSSLLQFFVTSCRLKRLNNHPSITPRSVTTLRRVSGTWCLQLGLGWLGAEQWSGATNIMGIYHQANMIWGGLAMSKNGTTRQEGYFGYFIAKSNPKTVIAFDNKWQQSLHVSLGCVSQHQAWWVAGVYIP